MTQQSFFDRLNQAVEKSGNTPLTQEQADEALRTAQALERMRLNRKNATSNLIQLAEDLDKLLSEAQVSDKAREVLDFFIELTLIDQADASRQLLKDKDAQIRQDLLLQWSLTLLSAP